MPIKEALLFRQALPGSPFDGDGAALRAHGHVPGVPDGVGRFVNPERRALSTHHRDL